MSRPIKPPAYRKRLLPQGERAYVTFRDASTGRTKDFNLGVYGSGASRERYGRLLSEWEARSRRLAGDIAPAHGPTVTQLYAKFWRSICGRYSRSHPINQATAIRILRGLYGTTAATAFGPSALRLVRQAMIDGDLHATPRPRKPWSRSVVNDFRRLIIRIFKWGVGRELLPASVYESLRCVESLKRGQTAARETESVKPAPDAYIAAAREHVSLQVAAMIELQLATGMRPGELVAMRPCDIDMGRRVWLYQPERHKTAHHGKSRTIYLGPRAQRAIRPFLKRSTVAPLFSAAEADAHRRAELSRRRNTPASCGNRPGTNRREHPKCVPGDHYSVASYRRAIERACAAADVPRWHPHQLRHNYATAVRAQYGVETARIMLGHHSIPMVELYAERDMDRAREIVGEIG